jgi:LuxR family maltose regulon positive regulatory protein
VSDVNRDTRFEFDRPAAQHSGDAHAPTGAERRRQWTGFPRVPVRLVPRASKFRRLDRLAAVTIVEALPGFGKTTLLADWARQQRAARAHVVWIRATPELDDLNAFMACLHEELLRSEALQQAVPADSGESSWSWIEEVALSATPVIVVVDDGHRLSSPAVADALLGMTAGIHQLHVIVAADTGRHHFGDAALRHRLETNVLTAADLSVSAAEVPAFATAWGHHLDPRSAEVLHDLVGGWLLPLRLVLDATPRWSPWFATHAADDFLLNQVLPDITDAVGFGTAIRFAVPEVLDVDLAASLLRRGDTAVSPPALGELALAALERQGLLWRVPRHTGPSQWRFPRLIRRALLEQFEQSAPDAAVAAHREVAHFFVARGDLRANELLRHARSAGDWSLLAQLWEQHGWSLSGGDAQAFEFAYAGIPDTARQELPSLTLAGALGDGLASTADGAGWMQRSEALLRQYMQIGADFLSAPRRRSYGHAELGELLTSAMIARRSDGNLDDALRLGADANREFARARVEEPDRTRASQEAWFQLQLAITQLQDGRYNAAMELATVTYQMSPNNLIGAGATGLLAAMHALSGQSAETEHWLQIHSSIDLTGHWAAGLAQLPARLARAMLALDRLEQAAAAAELDGLTLGAEASGLWPLILTVHTRYAMLFGDPVSTLARLEHLGRVLDRHLHRSHSVGRQVFDRCMVELTMSLGEVNRAQSRLGEGLEVPAWLMAPAARFHLITGDPRKALRIASAGGWRRDVHSRDRLQLLVIGALAYRAIGKHERSGEIFRRAYALIQDGGNLEPLLHIPAGTRAELLKASALRLDPRIEDRLRSLRPAYPENAELIQLSPRELEVLRQMPHHETAAGLARKLSVSVNTVKKQLVSLYAKLEVHDRSSALLRAERLGFLDQTDEVAGKNGSPGFRDRF